MEDGPMAFSLCDVRLIITDDYVFKKHQLPMLWAVTVGFETLHPPFPKIKLRSAVFTLPDVFPLRRLAFSATFAKVNTARRTG